ncbi:cytochrome c [Alcaligenaceae bacterium CGII-47]|nr:cytochrome c [Alcaligenaceae bacterium CGII-47]
MTGAALACTASAVAGEAQPDAAQLEEGKVLFQKGAVPACAVCHTLVDAGATGPIGPDLDELKPTREQLLSMMRDGSGAMPSFEDSLSTSQREAIAAYVVHVTHGQ